MIHSKKGPLVFHSGKTLRRRDNAEKKQNLPPLPPPWEKKSKETCRYSPAAWFSSRGERRRPMTARKQRAGNQNPDLGNQFAPGKQFYDVGEVRRGERGSGRTGKRKRKGARGDEERGVYFPPPGREELSKKTREGKMCKTAENVKFVRANVLPVTLSRVCITGCYRCRLLGNAYADTLRTWRQSLSKLTSTNSGDTLEFLTRLPS